MTSGSNQGSDAESLAASSAAADEDFRTEPASAPIKACKNPSWVDFRLVVPDGSPVAGRPFRLTLPDRSTKEGVTDADGLAGADGIDPGKCTILFLPPEGAGRSGS